MSIGPISSSSAVTSSLHEAATAPRTTAAPTKDAESALTPTNAADAGSVVSSGAQAQPTREQIDDALRQLHEAMPNEARNLLFSVDRDTGRAVVKIIDSTTKELIVQIPSKELLALTKSLSKLVGLFVTDQA